MTATAPAAVHFSAPSRLAGLGGFALLTFSAALAAGFVAEVSEPRVAVEVGPVEFATLESPRQDPTLVLSSAPLSTGDCAATPARAARAARRSAGNRAVYR